MSVMPRYVYQPPTFQCEIEDCGRDAMSSTSRVCRRHYMQRWRAANPDKVAEYMRRDPLYRGRG